MNTNTHPLIQIQTQTQTIIVLLYARVCFSNIFILFEYFNSKSRGLLLLVELVHAVVFGRYGK